MKKAAFSLLLLFSLWSSQAQTLEVYGGANLTRFFDYGNISGHFSSTYTSGSGAQFGIGFEHLKVKWFPLGGTFSIVHCGKSSLEMEDGGLGGGTFTEAEVETTSLNLAFYPVNIRLLKRHLEISLGAEASGIIRENLSGVEGGWSLAGLAGGFHKTEREINNQTPDFSKKWNIGALFRLGLCFPMDEGWEVVPQYKLFWGLTRRFQNIEAETLFRQHLFELSVRKTIY